MAASAGDLAEEMLSKPPPVFEVLQSFEFRDHVEPHDDNLQEKLEIEFNEAFMNALTQIRARFGEPSTLDEPSIELPMNGFRNAVWFVEENAMSLIAGHEDRECPYVLLLSVTPKKTN